jgi:protein TonB
MLPRRNAGFLGASAALHAVALAAMIWVATRPVSPPAEQPVALVWENSEDGARDAQDSAGAPAVPATPPSVPPPAAPAAMARPAEPVAPPPPPPPPVPPPMTPAAIVPRAPPAAPPPPPPPLDVAAPAIAAAPPPPAPPADSAPRAVAAAPAPPPPPPPAPPADAAPRSVAAAPPPAQPVQPAPRRTEWTPPVRTPRQEAAAGSTGGGIAEGAIVPARIAATAANAPPEYPRRSRERGEQGRVTLLVQVTPEGRVAALSVLGSSGYPALDVEAERAVRRWRFEPARQDGRAVAATLSVAVNFRLEGERRW